MGGIVEAFVSQEQTTAHVLHDSHRPHTARRKCVLKIQKKSGCDEVDWRPSETLKTRKNFVAVVLVIITIHNHSYIFTVKQLMNA